MNSFLSKYSYRTMSQKKTTEHFNAAGLNVIKKHSG